MDSLERQHLLYWLEDPEAIYDLVARRLRDINEACFRAGATETVLVLCDPDVVVKYRKADKTWGTVVWYGAGKVVTACTS